MELLAAPVLKQAVAFALEWMVPERKDDLVTRIVIDTRVFRP